MLIYSGMTVSAWLSWLCHDQQAVDYVCTTRTSVARSRNCPEAKELRAQRNAHIVALSRQGWTLVNLGNKFGLNAHSVSLVLERA
jgi:hypothetical protein